jgi:low affinity Fe/Cu permease
MLVLLWAPSLPLFGTVDTWQLVINTMTTIITFLLVALLQNSQWRGNKATNEKLDAIAAGLSDTMESLAAVMANLDIPDHHDRMRDQARELRETVGIEDRISTSSEEKPDAAHGDYQPEREREPSVSSGS